MIQNIVFVQKSLLNATVLPVFGVLECTGSVQGTGVEPTFRTAYMHPEKWNKAWFGSFQLQGG